MRHHVYSKRKMISNLEEYGDSMDGAMVVVAAILMTTGVPLVAHIFSLLLKYRNDKLFR